MIEAKFADAQVGDRVKSVTYGKGMITYTNHESATPTMYPIQVQFKSTPNTLHTFTIDGHFSAILGGDPETDLNYRKKRRK